MRHKTSEEIKQAIEDQKKLCEEKDWPHFAPMDGYCYNCRHNVYQNYDDDFVTLGKDGKELVTGCPHCKISYCE